MRQRHDASPVKSMVRPRPYRCTAAKARAGEAIGVLPPKWVFPYVIADSRNVISGAPFGSGADSALWADFKGKVLLVVNTASQCGFTPQYKGLEALHKKFSASGFAVLGFPSNQFGAQEPGADTEIAEFCEMNFGVTFPMFSKIDVNGANAHPLYKYLTSEKKGLLGSEAVKWNFTKFLIGKDGAVLERYAPTTEPEDISRDVARALAA